MSQDRMLAKVPASNSSGRIAGTGRKRPLASTAGPVSGVFLQGAGANARALSPDHALRLQTAIGNRVARRFLAAPTGLARSPAPPALPTTVADPEAGRVSDELPEAARRNIKVRPVGVSQETIDRAFPKRAGSNVQSYHPLPRGATLRFGGHVNFWMRILLEELAGTLIPFILAPNTTMTFDLDLVHLGLGHDAYRFTYVDFHPADPKQQRLHQVIIEHLGEVGAEKPGQKEPRQRRFDRLGFKRDTTWTDDGQFTVLLGALERVPDHLLAPLKGLTFKRAATDPGGAAGNYDLPTHAITIFDKAFVTSATRIGDVEHGLVTLAQQNIIHELGHALDYQPLRQLYVREQEARSRLLTTFKPYQTRSGQYRFPASKQALWNRLSAQHAAALKALRGGELISGASLSELTAAQPGQAPAQDAGSNEFRKAALRDGNLRLTDYSEKGWNEYFAEAFSIYIADPEALRRLRPNLFAWFDKTYPLRPAGAAP